MNRSRRHLLLLAMAANGGGSAPSSEFRFDGRALPSSLTFTRASGATRINQRGYLEEVAADVLRYSYDTALGYNELGNPFGDGGTIGAAFPVGFSPTGGGISWSENFIGRGTTSDGLPYVDLEMSGTPVNTAGATIITANFDSTDFLASAGTTAAGWVGVVVLSATGVSAPFVVRFRAFSTFGLADFNAVASDVGLMDERRLTSSRTFSNGSTQRIAWELGAPATTAGVPVVLRLRFILPVINRSATPLTDTVPIATLAQRVGTTPQYGLEGALIERIPATNLFLNSAVGVTQNVTTTAVQHTLSFTGTGSITLTGTSTAGPLAGTGASNRVSLVFTPSAGALTLTIAGDVRTVQLETGFLSSYIVTAGVAATRAADIANIDPTMIDLDKSSIAARFRIERGGVDVAATGVESHLSIVDADGSDQLLVNTNTAVYPRLLAREAAGATTQIQLSAVGSGAFQTVAAAWDASATDGAFNGVTPSNSAVSPAGTTAAIQIGASGFNLTPSNGTYKRLSIWKGRRLTAAQVQAQSARTT
jgi:hypothetical protein